MDADLDCPICFTLMEDPRSLPCGHSLCFECIQKINRKDGFVTCPMCRKMVPQGSTFPKNYLLCKIIEASKNNQNTHSEASRVQSNARGLITSCVGRIQEQLLKKELSMLEELKKNESGELEIRSNLETVELEVYRVLAKAYCVIGFHTNENKASPFLPEITNAPPKRVLNQVPVARKPSNEKAPLPPQSSPAKSTNKIYVIGGNSSSKSSILVYDRINDSATSVPCKFTPRLFSSAIQLASKVYVVGGENGAALQSCFSFDPLSNQCLELPNLNNARTRADLTYIGNTIYVAGGGNGRTIQTSLELLDLRESRWQVISRDAKPRLSHKLIAHKEDIYLIGGFNGKGYSDKVEVFDLRMRKWRRHSKMNCAKSDFASCVTPDGSLMTLGGHNSGEVVEVYKAGQWHRDQRLPYQVRNGLVIIENGYARLYSNLVQLEKLLDDEREWIATECANLKVDAGAALC